MRPEPIVCNCDILPGSAVVRRGFEGHVKEVLEADRVRGVHMLLLLMNQLEIKWVCCRRLVRADDLGSLQRVKRHIKSDEVNWNTPGAPGYTG